MPYCDPIRTGHSLRRLESLIAARAAAGADQAAIDRRIWDLFGERWAVMFTDLSGFSRRVAEFGIIHFLQIIHESQRVLVPVLEEHDGILLKVEGDSMLVIFRRPESAVTAAVAMQRSLETYNTHRKDEEQVLLCVGLGYGDVLRIGDHDVFGAEVNAASKLGEDTAGPREILATQAVHDAVAGRTFEALDTVPPGAPAAYRLRYERTPL